MDRVQRVWQLQRSNRLTLVLLPRLHPQHNVPTEQQTKLIFRRVFKKCENTSTNSPVHLHFSGFPHLIQECHYRTRISFRIPLALKSRVENCLNKCSLSAHEKQQLFPHPTKCKRKIISSSERDSSNGRLL